MALTHVSGSNATSVCWHSDSEGEVESSPSASKRRTGCKTSGHQSGVKAGFVVAVVLPRKSVLLY